jgi:hypothetical protein
MHRLHAATAVFVFVLGSTSVAFAQNVPADFIKARNERVEALAKGDKAGFDRLTASNFIVTDPTGRVENKTERGGRVTHATRHPCAA